MAAIKDNISLTVAEIKSWLGLSGTTFDPLLTLVRSATLDLADEYCNNGFLDDDGDVVIPDGVKLGVLQCIVAAWQQCPAAVAAGVNAANVSSRNVDGVSVSYGAGSAGFFGVTDLMGGMGPMIRNALSAYRLMPS
jgi:hypothetical protein